MLPRKQSRRKFAMRTFSLIKNSSTVNRAPQSSDTGLFHELFNRTHIVQLVIDPVTARIIDSNPAACEFYGYSLAQIQSMTIDDINASPALQIQAIKQQVIDEKATTFQTRHRLASGEIRDVNVQTGFITLADKTYLYSIIQDITERKQIENALRETEQLYRLFAQNMPDASVVMFDTNMRYTLVEGLFLKFLGPRFTPAVGQTLQEIALPKEVQDFLIPIYQRALRGESFSYERETPDYAYQARVSPVKDSSGTIIGGMVLSHNISERKRLENDLRSSEEQLRLITDNMQDLITRIDAQDKTLFASASYRAVLGYDPAELIGKSPQELVHPDDKCMINALQQASIEAGQPYIRGEGRLRHADGHYIDVETTGKFLYDEQGEFLGGIYVARDISERKRLEAALRASEERLRLITNNMQDLVILADENEEIVYISPSISTAMGYDTKTIVGTTPIEAIHPDDRERVLQILQSSFVARLSDFTVEMRLRHIAGYYMDFETNCRILYDDQWNLLGTIFVARDITERKRLEAALRASEERLRLITDNVQDLILLTNPQRETVYFSPSFTRVLGYGEDFLHAKMPVEFVHPDDRQRVGESIQKVFDRQESQVIIELRVPHSDGHYINFEDVFRPLYDPDGRLTGILHVFRDITNRRQMEDLLLEKQKLQTALEKEQELSTIKTRMMQRISHEFRTPLSVIQVATETLTHYHHRLTDEKRKAKNVTVQTQIRRITGMLDEMALVLRSTSNASEFHPTAINLADLCREIAAELSVSLGLPGKYQLDMEPNLVASIDAAVLRDGLSHIMRNAARYSEPADPVIVRLTQTAAMIELCVIDHGIGIPADELPRIFEAFYRGSNVNERGGLGIGLTIARAAIEAHGGTIRVESEVGKGTTFVIGLPVPPP